MLPCLVWCPVHFSGIDSCDSTTLPRHLRRINLTMCHRDRYRCHRSPVLDVNLLVSVTDSQAAQCIAESVMWRCVVRPYICPSIYLFRRHTHSDSPGAACDAASVPFGLTTTTIAQTCQLCSLFIVVWYASHVTGPTGDRTGKNEGIGYLGWKRRTVSFGHQLSL